ncbi:MAG: hypothetical protein ACPGU1_02985 [Myxococcota bacterium]
MQYYRHSTAKTLTAVIFMTVVISLSTSMASAALPPLDEAQRAVLTGIPEDPAPKSLVRGNHYVISNEDRPHLFHHALDKRGGVMVGVGTDQLYVYAGWARSELLIPMDFDRTVVDLHRIYGLLFTQAATPAEFIKLWHKRNEKTVRGWLDAHETDPVLRERLGYAFKIGRQLVYARLKRLHREYKRSSTPTFVSDQAQYDHLVDLIRSGRFHPVRGDLTKTGCMKGMGEALVKLGHTLDVIYLSNAEQYFDFKQPFRDNFLNLPIDDSSLVLRTSPRNGGKGQYRYETQRTVDFQAWLKRPKVKRVKQIRRHRKAGPEKDTSIFPAPPE